MTDEEIKALPVETLREALYYKKLRDLGTEFFDTYWCIGKVWNFNLVTRLRDLQRHIEDAAAIDPNPHLTLDNLWFIRSVVKQLSENSTVRDNIELAKWGLLAAANSCYGSSMITGKTFRRWGARLKRQGLSTKCFLTLPNP